MPVSSRRLVNIRGFAFLVATAALMGCHGSGGSDVQVPQVPQVVIGEDTIHSLSLTRAVADAQLQTLHWRLTDGAEPVDQFLVYSAAEPMTREDRETNLVGTVTGEVRQFDLRIEPGSGVRYLTIVAFAADGVELSQSLSLPIDTASYIAFSQSGVNNTELWLARMDEVAEPELVANDAAHANWAPGSRSLLFSNRASLLAERFAPLNWPDDMRHATDAAALPLEGVQRDWHSMRVSPSGLLAYRGLRSAQTQLYIAQSDGSSRQISDGGGVVHQFGWAPVGPNLAYLRCGTGLNTHLFVYKVSTKTLGEVSRALDPDEYVLFAEWSPDGKRLAFSIVDAKTSGGGELYLHDLEKSVTHKVADELGHTLAWSPDGQGLVFTVLFEIGRQSNPPNGATVEIAHVEFPLPSGASPASQVGYLYASVDGIQDLRWNPNGSLLSFVSRTQAGVKTMLVFDPVSKEFAAEVVLPATHTLMSYKWSPSGDRLACQLRLDLNDRLDVFDFSAATSPAPSVTWTGGRQIVQYEWAPHSERIAVIMGDVLQNSLYILGATSEMLVSKALKKGQSVTDLTWSSWTGISRPYIYSRLLFK